VNNLVNMHGISVKIWSKQLKRGAKSKMTPSLGMHLKLQN